MKNGLTWSPKQVKLSDLKENPANPKIISEQGKKRLQKSLSKFGLAGSIIVNTDLQIIDGHSRKKELLSNGLTEKDKIWVSVPNRKLTEKEYAEFNAIIDVAKAGEPDVFLMEETFGDEFMTEWELEGKAKVATEDDYQIPDEIQTDIVLGDLFQIGQHRLLCGDSTDGAQVERLMGEEKADMVFTDPPYGVNYEGGRNPVSNVPREKLKGDTSAVLYSEVLLAAMPYCKTSAPWYFWFASTVGKPVYEPVENAGLKIRAMIIWNKLNPHYGNFMAQYMQKHEPCLYCVRETPKWYGATNEVTVWDIVQPTKNEHHPTQKPVELASRAIKNSSKGEDICADFFLGSGTTMVAAHQLNRRCFGMEIDPKYCQVILDRMRKLDPTLEIIKI